VKLAKLRQVVLGDVVASQVQHGVLQGASMPIAQDEAITIDPSRILAAVVHYMTPQNVSHGSAAHGSSRVPRVSSLRLISRYGTDSVYALELEGHDACRFE